MILIEREPFVTSVVNLGYGRGYIAPLQLVSWEAFPLGYRNNFKFKLKDHSVRAFLARVRNKKQDVLELMFHSKICFAIQYKIRTNTGIYIDMNTCLV